MSDEESKTGLVSKTLGVVLWGEVLCIAAFFAWPSIFADFDRPGFDAFLLAGLWWPVLWLIFWVLRLALPLPFELFPRAIELVLVSPGHFLAWLFLSGGSKDEE